MHPVKNGWGFVFEASPYAARVWANKVSNEMAKQHPGFKSVQSSIAKKEGISPDRAGAILASSTRKASASAKKANPRLKRVK